jgi:dihydroneopterin aldolase
MSFRTRVGIADLEVDCVIGANAEERDREQAVLISFEIEYGPAGADGGPAGAGDPVGAGDPGGAGTPGDPGRDELDAAVDYADAADRIRRIAREGRYVLLETLARAVADDLSRDERVAALTVECRKPGALADAAYACARVTWSRD